LELYSTRGGEEGRRYRPKKKTSHDLHLPEGRALFKSGGGSTAASKSQETHTRNLQSTSVSSPNHRGAKLHGYLMRITPRCLGGVKRLTDGQSGPAVGLPENDPAKKTPLDPKPSIAESPKKANRDHDKREKTAVSRQSNRHSLHNPRGETRNHGLEGWGGGRQPTQGAIVGPISF